VDKAIIKKNPLQFSEVAHHKCLIKDNKTFSVKCNRNSNEKDVLFQDKHVSTIQLFVSLKSNVCVE